MRSRIVASDATEISSSAKSIPLQQRDQVKQTVFDRLQAIREGALKLLRRNLGFEKASASQSNRAPPRPASGPGVVKKGAHGEFTRLGKTRTPRRASSTMCRSTTGEPCAEISTTSSVV